MGIILMIASSFLVTTRSFENLRSEKIRRIYRNMMGWIPAPPESTPKILYSDYPYETAIYVLYAISRV